MYRVGVSVWIDEPAAACAGESKQKNKCYYRLSVCNVRLLSSMVLLTHHFSCAVPTRMHRHAHVSGNVPRGAIATSHDFCIR